MLRIGKFAVEHLREGCVTDAARPRFSWYVESDRAGAEVTDALLTVGDWSKRGAGQIAEAYAGAPLAPFTTYEAQLAVRDDAGEEAQAQLTFETGRMGTPWQGQWITDGSYHFTEKKASPVPLSFRRQICLKKPLARARIYATALGIYNLYLDGQRVGENYFAPGFTSYKNQLQYQTYDVTGQLAGAAHTLTFVVSGGWAVGRFTYKSRNRIFAKRQALLAELRLTYADGTEEVIGTDTDWEVTRDGRFREAEFYNGEVYDASRDEADMHWTPASLERVSLHPVLTADYGAPVRAHEVIRPVSVTRSPSGVLVYDMGQNFAGVVRAAIKGARIGQRLTFTHAEVLMDGELYREPLRTAKQEAVYICREGDQVYQPSLTYMGFRYVGVAGIDQENIEVEGVALYSAITPHGDFRCSDERINRLQQNITWGARSNFVDIPTDCPQRDERLGWTGDIALFGQTAVWNFEMSRFLEKWLNDVKADQGWGGGIPMIVPFTKLYWQWELVITMAVDHWGDACILVPWALYQNTGDVGVLEAMYPVMQKYIRACRFWAGIGVGKHRYIWKLLHHYGDWVAPGVDMWTWMRRGKYTATASLSHTALLMSHIADLLGRGEDRTAYEKLHERTAEAYRQILMTPDCHIQGDFQTGYVLPLYYRMLNAADRRKTAANLAERVRKDGWHIGTGFPGTPYILFALADNGYADDAFRMLMNDTCPSWLYEVKTGGTTIWERWDALREDGTCNTGKDDGTGGMVSFNHYASGAVGDFLYRRVLGVEPEEGGYRTFRVSPLLGGGLTEAEGFVDTAYGRIACRWAIEQPSAAQGRSFTIEVCVPVGTTCELYLPDGSKQKLGSGRHCCSVTM